jgi:putative peptide zinc metalloprotease protein
VRRGDLLVELENPSITKGIIELEGRIEALRSRIDSLRTMRIRNEQAGDQLPQTIEALKDLEKQLEQRKDQKRQLALTAPVDGVVLPAERRSPTNSPHDLPAWGGTPLDAINAGCTLESGTTYCLIGDPARLSAVLVVDQSDIELVRVGQPVRIWLKQLPGGNLSGAVAQISDSQLESAPAAIVADGGLPVVRDESGSARPASASFQVRVSIDPQDRTVPLRSTGSASIAVQPQSLGRRIYRYLAATFRFA